MSLQTEVPAGPPSTSVTASGPSVPIPARSGGDGDARTGARGQEGAGVADVPELRFVRPLPGFGELTRFVLVSLDEAPDGGVDGEAGDVMPPLLYELRSLEAPQVRFLVAAPVAFFPDYTVELDEAACGELDLRDAGDALVLVVLTSGQDAASTTANLLAPVVINARTRSAAQVILSGTDWPVRAPLG